MLLIYVQRLEQPTPGRRAITAGAALHGGGGVQHSPNCQREGKLLCQSANLDWLVITTKQTEIDNILNMEEGTFHLFFHL